ncbi:MAG: Lrp/AsnC family transcriptional regulator [Thaumarchaeota archaeon]|nr:Lrp/AsnC family transcriptional regulator [Nitrososphaerota archaeon]
MARTRAVQAFRDEPIDLEARIINAIREVGPKNVSLLSRKTGAHAETVRYKMKKQFKRLGFRIHADVDYRKIGLSLHWATVQFTPKYRDAAPAVFRVLNRIGYLTYYAKMLPRGSYVALFALPSGTTDQYRSFLEHLESSGIFADFTFDEVLASRHNSMNPKYFNFRSGRWEVVWNSLSSDEGNPLRVDTKHVEASPDYYDLLLIKELQKDALQHIVAIARKLKVHQKTLEYHYRAHVQREKLIPGFVIRWTQDIEKSLAHSVVLARITFSGLGRAEFVEAQAVISRIPFLWAEDLLSDGTYIATLCIPVEEVLTTFDHINKQLPDLNSSLDVGYIKVSDAWLFTIPYNMYGDKGWKFDVPQMVSLFAKEARYAK